MDQILAPGQKLCFKSKDRAEITVEILKPIGLLTEEQEDCLRLINGQLLVNGERVGLAYPDDDDGDTIDQLFVFDRTGWYSCKIVQ